MCGGEECPRLLIFAVTNAPEPLGEYTTAERKYESTVLCTRVCVPHPHPGVDRFGVHHHLTVTLRHYFLHPSLQQIPFLVNLFLILQSLRRPLLRSDIHYLFVSLFFVH